MTDQIELEGRVLKAPEDPEMIVEPTYISVELSDEAVRTIGRNYLTIPRNFCCVDPVPLPGETVLVAAIPPEQPQTDEFYLQVRIISRGEL